MLLIYLGHETDAGAEMKQVVITSLVAFVASCGVPAETTTMGANENDLGRQSTETHEVDAKIIKPYCITCHSSASKRNGMDSLTNLSQLAAQAINKAQSGKGAQNNKDLIVPGKPSSSQLYLQIASKKMPPKGRPSVPPQLALKLKKWIESLK